HLTRAREREDDVTVLLHRLARALAAQELAAHAEVDDEDVAAIELPEQVLALPLDAGDLVPLQPVDELLLRPVARDGAQPVDVDGLDALARDLLLEVAPDRLNFGELRHD